MTEIAIHADLREAVILHQRFDENPLGSPFLEGRNLLRGQFLLWAEAYATFFGSLHPIHLSLGTYLRFKLADGAEHIEHGV